MWETLNDDAEVRVAPNRCQVVAPGLTIASKVALARAPKLHESIFRERLVSSKWGAYQRSTGCSNGHLACTHLAQRE